MLIIEELRRVQAIVLHATISFLQLSTTSVSWAHTIRNDRYQIHHRLSASGVSSYHHEHRLDQHSFSSSCFLCCITARSGSFSISDGRNSWDVSNIGVICLHCMEVAIPFNCSSPPLLLLLLLLLLHFTPAPACVCLVSCVLAPPYIEVFDASILMVFSQVFFVSITLEIALHCLSFSGTDISVFCSAAVSSKLQR